MAQKSKPTHRNPWLWVPSLYFGEGIPYVIVMTVSVIFYKRMGISNTDIALYTSWLYLPWVIKPLWSPIVEILKTKRFWIISMQLLIGAGLAGVALMIPGPKFFTYTLAFFWLLAFSSATHDIAADGFYMLGLDKHTQTLFVGIRSTFYRIAMITAQGVLIILAGYIESHSGLTPVDVRITAKSEVTQVAHVIPESLTYSAEEGELRIIAGTQSFELATGTINKKEADSLLALVKKWNEKNGFVISPDKQVGGSQEPSWWSRNVAEPLGTFLKKNFGPSVRVQKTGIAGNLGFVYFHLSQKPEDGKEIVVTFTRESGDEISIAEGSHLIFTAENWNKPAIAVLQVDPKLKTTVECAFQARSGNLPYAWSLTFYVIAGVFVLLFVYHRFILPYPTTDHSISTGGLSGFFRDFFKTFEEFFRKKEIVVILLFLLLYRFAEAQLVKLVTPFLLDSREVGGLGMTTGQIGLAYGTIGIAALTLGGILGGLFAAKKGLKASLWWFVCIIHFPDLVFLFLSYFQPENFWVITMGVATEQFGYGFGFTAYMLYMLYVSQGEYKTAHYAICTGFMALGMMLPGMFSGWLQELIGYQHFFVWIILSTIPGFLVAALVKIDPLFGKKEEVKTS